MRYSYSSVEYDANLAAFHELEEVIPMTSMERKSFLNWVRYGHDLDSNPWGYYDQFGFEMCFLRALRIRNGSSHGPWDDWEYDVPYRYEDPNNQFVSF